MFVVCVGSRIENEKNLTKVLLLFFFRLHADSNIVAAAADA